MYTKEGEPFIRTVDKVKSVSAVGGQGNKDCIIVKKEPNGDIEWYPVVRGHGFIEGDRPQITPKTTHYASGGSSTRFILRPALKSHK